MKCSKGAGVYPDSKDINMEISEFMLSYTAYSSNGNRIIVLGDCFPEFVLESEKVYRKENNI
jgi:hypothetical protein